MPLCPNLRMYLVSDGIGGFGFASCEAAQVTGSLWVDYWGDKKEGKDKGKAVMHRDLFLHRDLPLERDCSSLG